MTLTGCQVENNGYNTANLLTTDGDTASNTFPGLDVQGARHDENQPLRYFEQCGQRRAVLP